MIIKVYDSIPRDSIFPCKDVITKVKSVIWNDRFYKMGNFQISLTDTDLKPMDLITFKDKAGLVLKVVKNTGAEVYGYDLKCLFNFRYFNSEAVYTGTAEEILYSIANDLLNAEERAIDGIHIPTSQILGLTESTELNTEVKNAADVLYDFCLKNEIAYDITFDENKGFNFVVKKGRDMADIIRFSRNERNLDSAEYTHDIISSVNVAYTKEGIEGSASGINRREGSKLAEEVETLRGTANDRNIVGSEWILGDYVTVSFNDYVARKQITEIKTAFEPNNKKIIPIFGTEKENPISKILR